MPAAEVESDAVREELDAILKSSGFARNERLSQFLRFLVERHLEGRDRELKESVIGTEVFGRKPDYDPKRDPIVRTEARRLRERLSQYYENAGAGDPVRIELPKGGYVPAIRGVEAAAVRPRNWRLIGIACAGLIVIVVAVGLTSHKTSPEVQDLYVRARAFQVLPSVSGIESSIDLFQQAIVKDPRFAPAYAGIAAGYAARSAFDGFDAAQRADMFARGWAAARKAIELDGRSADAYDGLAMMQARQSQWAAAEHSFRRAIELAPRDPIWRDHFAMFLLLPLNRVEEAIRQLRAAEEIDPLSPQTHSALRLALRAAGRHDEEFSHCQKAAQNDRQRSDCWAENLFQQGKNEEAVRMLEVAWSDHLLEPGGHILGIAYAKAGRREDAERVAARLPRLASKAQIFAALGDKDRTFEVLARMASMGPARMGRDFLLNPNFAFLHGDPRLAAVRKSVGLPD